MHCSLGNREAAGILNADLKEWLYGTQFIYLLRFSQLPLPTPPHPAVGVHVCTPTYITHTYIFTTWTLGTYPTSLLFYWDHQLAVSATPVEGPGVGWPSLDLSRVEAARAVTPISTATVAMKAIDTTFTLGFRWRTKQWVLGNGFPRGNPGGSGCQAQKYGNVNSLGGILGQTSCRRWETAETYILLFYFSQ